MSFDATDPALLDLVEQHMLQMPSPTFRAPVPIAISLASYKQRRVEYMASLRKSTSRGIRYASMLVTFCQIGSTVTDDTASHTQLTVRDLKAYDWLCAQPVHAGIVLHPATILGVAREIHPSSGLPHYHVALYWKTPSMRMKHWQLLQWMYAQFPEFKGQINISSSFNEPSHMFTYISKFDLCPLKHGWEHLSAKARPSSGVMDAAYALIRSGEHPMSVITNSKSYAVFRSRLDMLAVPGFIRHADLMLIPILQRSISAPDNPYNPVVDLTDVQRVIFKYLGWAIKNINTLPMRMRNFLIQAPPRTGKTSVLTALSASNAISVWISTSKDHFYFDQYKGIEDICVHDEYEGQCPLSMINAFMATETGLIVPIKGGSCSRTNNKVINIFLTNCAQLIYETDSNRAAFFDRFELPSSSVSVTDNQYTLPPSAFSIVQCQAIGGMTILDPARALATLSMYVSRAPVFTPPVVSPSQTNISSILACDM